MVAVSHFSSRPPTQSLYLPMIFQPVFLWAFQAFIPSTLGLTGATTNTGPGMAPYENPGNHSNVQAQMESFVGQLRSLIYHTHFNYPKFEANAEVLDKQVSHITASFNEVSPRTKHLSNQFRFTTKLFETMAVAAKYIRSKNMFGEPYCSMVREICDLHVTVLTMFNSHGLPDKVLVITPRKLRISSVDCVDSAMNI
ncbi:hypothetical protein JCM33374_g4426 [Metschnikowia sp. JCM 33374]|nr:hypothetical protein JCM33374_g4426 [Metschnikowia sp. JCM 33374]